MINLIIKYFPSEEIPRQQYNEMKKNEKFYIYNKNNCGWIIEKILNIMEDMFKISGYFSSIMHVDKSWEKVQKTAIKLPARIIKKFPKLKENLKHSYKETIVHSPKCRGCENPNSLICFQIYGEKCGRGTEETEVIIDVQGEILSLKKSIRIFYDQLLLKYNNMKFIEK